jgi:quercetin dioxygenase-like cupin family protein
MIKMVLSAAALLLLATGGACAGEAIRDKYKATVVFDRELPNVPGESIRTVLVEYQPGGSSPAHTHATSAFIYATVLEGSVRSKVNDDPEQVYRVGESFYEEPGAHHSVSANASQTEVARLLAIFIVNTDERALTKPDRK